MNTKLVFRRVTCKRCEGEKKILDLFSIAMEFNLAYKKDSFRIPFYYYF